MLHGDLVAFLDACVLWPASLRDTLLRLAEMPKQYQPRWSDDVWDEVCRNLQARRKLTEAQIRHLRQQVLRHFPDASVNDYAHLIPLMRNHEKDRHVVAAAVRGQAQVIVTANLKDFPPETLDVWGLEAQHPDVFLCRHYDLAPGMVIEKLHKQAQDIRRDLPALLRTLRKGVPTFADVIADELGLNLEP